MRSRFAPLVAATALIALLASACATVPTTGPIVSGPVIEAGGPAQSIRVIAAPPPVGATPTEIVAGFLQANVSRDADFEIARQYLTPKASADWRPEVSTTVYERDSLTVRDGPSDSVVAVMSIVGRVRPNGALVVVDPPRRTSWEFQLQVAVEGGSEGPRWRITNPQPGILISDVDLGRAQRSYQVFFASARSDVLVPEGRYLPAAGPSLPTALAERVLAGPSAWLEPGLLTAAPEGTELALGAVPVDEGVAVVDLTEPALTADGDQRRTLAAQLTWTLTQVPGVNRVRLRSGGQDLEIPGAPPEMQRATWQSRGPDSLTSGPDGSAVVPYYVIDGSAIVRVSGADTSSVTPAGLDLARTHDLAISLDQTTASVVAANGQRLWLLPLEEGGEATALAAADTGGASFDIDGSVWFTDRGRVRRAAPDARAKTVSVPRPVSRSVTAVRLARDGARLILVVDGRLLLGVIEPIDGGVAVASVRRIAGGVTAVRGVAWRDATTLEVIGRLDGQAVQAVRVPVDALGAQVLRSPGQVREVAAAPSTATLLVSQSDILYFNIGLQWDARGPATSVAYPG